MPLIPLHCFFPEPQRPGKFFYGLQAGSAEPAAAFSAKKLFTSQPRRPPRPAADDTPLDAAQYAKRRPDINLQKKRLLRVNASSALQDSLLRFIVACSGLRGKGIKALELQKRKLEAFVLGNATTPRDEKFRPLKRLVVAIFRSSSSDRCERRSPILTIRTVARMEVLCQDPPRDPETAGPAAGSLV